MVRAGPPGLRCIQTQGFDISTSPLHQKMEYTELRLTHGVATFPWPRFSDARIQVRNIETLFLDTAKPRRSGTNPSIFWFLRDSVAPWCKGFAFGTSPRVCYNPCDAKIRASFDVFDGRYRFPPAGNQTADPGEGQLS